MPACQPWHKRKTHPFRLQHLDIALKVMQREICLVGVLRWLDQKDTGVTTDGEVIGVAFSDPLYSGDFSHPLEVARLVSDMSDYLARRVVDLPLGGHLKDGHTSVASDDRDGIGYRGEVENRAGGV